MTYRNLPASVSNEPLATLVEIVPMPLAFLDREFHFVYANQAAAEQVGRLREGLTGLPMSEVVPGYWPELKKIFKRVLTGETIVNHEVDLSELGSEPREWIASFYPVHDDGEVIAIACTSMDVTDLQEAKRALQSRNDLFAMLAKANSAVSRSTTKEELFAEICEIAINTGKFQHAWIGVPNNGLLVPIARAGDDGGYLRSLDDADLNISTDPEDRRSQGPTGQAYLHGTASFVNDYFKSPETEPWQAAALAVGFRGAAALPIREQGQVVAVLTLYAAEKDFFSSELIQTLAEITPSMSLAMDRFALEHQREEDEAEMILRDRALTAATQGVVITDAQAEDNPVIYATPAFEELTGYSSEEMRGRNCRILQGEGTDPSEVAKVRQAIADGHGCEVELINYRKDGESFWNRVMISPIFDDSGKLTHFVGVQTDVTERRKLERQVSQAQKMEAVGQLAGGVAHDFNNVLTAIRAAADLALAEVGPGSVREDLQQIDKAAERAAHLTQQLLAFSRRQVLQPQSTDLNLVVTETSALVSRVIGDNIELVERFAPGLPAVLVDRAQLQHVILNLCINARDAMPDGGTITIQTSASDLDESYVESRLVPVAGRYAVIEISDDGSGMSTETLSRIFEPFFTTKSEGTGLGLATAYGIVNQTGGHVAVESEIGVGTLFKIYLPTTSKAIEPDWSARGVPTESLDGGETILHVEDSEMLRPLVSRALGRHGYKVLSAANANEAIEIAEREQQNIDLMITDVVMPGMNGRELAEILLDKNPNLRVLFTSGYPEDMVIRDGISGHEVNFMEKPFLAKELLPLVRSILDDPPAGL